MYLKIFAKKKIIISILGKIDQTIQVLYLKDHLKMLNHLTILEKCGKIVQVALTP